MGMEGGSRIDKMAEISTAERGRKRANMMLSRREDPEVRGFFFLGGGEGTKQGGN